MSFKSLIGVAVALSLTAGAATAADVFNLGGVRNPQTGQWTGIASLETVAVGNSGNAADTRYIAAGSPYYGNGVGYGKVDYAYNIGKYEVTSGQYCEFLNAVAKTDTYRLFNGYMSNASFGCGIQRNGTSGNYTYSVAADYLNRPVNYVSWIDAARFANWLHNGQPAGAQDLTTTEDGAYYINGATTTSAILAVTRKADWKWALPSDDEWYKAAYYDPTLNGGDGGYWDYPTRSNTPTGQDMSDASGNNANCYTAPYVKPIDSGHSTTVVGEFQNSISPYGTLDQGGDVWEWNEAKIISYDPNYYQYRGLRGGSYADYSRTLLASCNFRYCPPNEDEYTGFRVVEVPEPATLSLLTLGGLALARRRRK